MTDLKNSALFEPFTLKSLTLRNRIVMAPMTRGFASGGVPGQPVVDYYHARALGEVGLILSEGTVIDRPASRNEPGIPFFHGEALDGWQAVIDAVHAAGGKMGPQIWHSGSVKSLTAGDWEPDAPVESPSGLVAPDNPRGLAMREEDIADSIAAWARAAGDAKRLGFDTLEIHAAHGYLIDQFFWAGTNVRTDGYGGSTLKERSRYAVELVRAMRAAVGPDFPILMRVSQWKQQDYSVRLAPSPQELEAWLCPLVEAGVDLLDCSQRRYWEAEFPEIDGEDGLNFAGWAKKLTGAATMTVGSVGLTQDFFTSFTGETSQSASIDPLLERLERGEFDLVGVGRALISNPDWAARVRRGDQASLNPFSGADLTTLK
jgi:2,4-dienoyl-CoA reductase-like NADH-dependent reductase (Old Yellow Enzyme family)